MKKKDSPSHHHRKPTSIGGKNNTGNLSLVSSRQHEAWHTLFSNKGAEEIADIINSKWLDPDYCFMVIKIKSHEKR